ncbi:MAG: CoA-binding protein [Ilumatobacteraceae bacterium]
MPEREPIPGWEPPSAGERKRILDETRSIAIVGASSNPARASNFVATYLLSSSADYAVYLVNPRETEILGQPVYPSLEDLPEVPDMVDVFRRSEDLPPIAQDAVAIGSKTFWAQLGLWSTEAARIASHAGLDVVMDRCTKIEHARFAGGLHLAGFDTGVITSRR